MFDNPEFKRGHEDVRLTGRKVGAVHHFHENDPATPEGLALIDKIRTRPSRRSGGTPWKAQGLPGWHGFGVQGHAARSQLRPADRRNRLAVFDFHHHADSYPKRGGRRCHRGHCGVVVGTSFGLSVLIWQEIMGVPLHWMVLAMSVIILLAVGSDYNLLLVSRFKEEIGAGINTGIIRSMAGTGAVVTSARLGVRVHDGLHARERPVGGRAGGLDDRPRPAVRHAGGAVVHDTVHRRTVGSLVLVAAGRASAAGSQAVARL